MCKDARRVVLGVVTVFAIGLIPSVAQAAVPGSLSQLPAPNNCIQPGDPSSECGTGNGTGLAGAQDIAVSPDGKNVYVASYGDNAIVEFTRNADGSLTQLTGSNNCLAEHNSTLCGTDSGYGLESPTAIIVSPDGKNVYVVGEEDRTGSIATFTRNADGSLTELGCIEEHGGSGSGCGTTTGQGLANPYHLAITPDGRNIYVADGGRSGDDNGAVSEFSRDPSTGALTELGCIEETPTVADECATTGKGLWSVNQVIVSSDGKNVYTALDNTPGAIAEFVRDPVTGLLTQLPAPNDCIQERSTSSGFGAGECGTQTGLGINDVYGLDGSPDGHNVYSASIDGTSPIAEFSRESTTGALTQLAKPNDCLEEHGGTDQVGCGNQTGHGLNGAYDLKVSPDGQNVYVVSTGGLASGDAIVELARNSDGSLTQLASPNDCIQETGGTDCGTTDGHGITNPLGLAISPDGANVYVAAAGARDPLAEFARVVPPATPPATQSSSSPPPSSQPQTAQSSPPAQPAAKKPKAKKTKKHHKKRKKHKKAVRAKRIKRPAPTFTG